MVDDDVCRLYNIINNYLHSTIVRTHTRGQRVSHSKCSTLGDETRARIESQSHVNRRIETIRRNEFELHLD